MTNYSLLSFILRGERRKTILLCLDKPMIPKEISQKCNVSIHNVSKSLKELVVIGEEPPHVLATFGSSPEITARTTKY